MQAVVVPPRVRVAYLDDEVVQLVDSLPLGCGLHPCDSLNPLLKGLLEVVYEREHLALAALGEVFLHIHFTDGHTQYFIYHTYGSLPTWTVHLGTAEYLAELKAGGSPLIVELVGRSHQDAAYSVGLEIFERCRLENPLYGMYGLWLTDGDVRNRGEAEHQERARPVNAGIVSEQTEICHLVVVALNVAQLDGAIAGLGDGLLDAKYVCSLGLSIGFALSDELEELGEVEAVSGDDPKGSRVGIDVIVTASET